MSFRCSRHNSRHKAWCAECVAVVEAYRAHRLERLEKLAEESRAKKEREADLKQRRERKHAAKWDEHGNCIFHGIPPTQRDTKSFCPRCYAASRRKGQRTRVEEIRQQQHDARVQAITVGSEIWECFCGDVFRRGVRLSQSYRREMGKQLRTMSKKAA